MESRVVDGHGATSGEVFRQDDVSGPITTFRVRRQERDGAERLPARDERNDHERLRAQCSQEQQVLGVT
jgi:hypothetical protein